MRQNKVTEKTDDPQLQIDWTRGKRKTWIGRLIIEPFEYVNSRGRRQKVCVTGKMKHLLEVLETFARDGGPCFLRIKTIEARMGYSRNTITRTIAACVGRGLLTVETNHDGTGESSSRYQIVWDEIAQVILDHPDTTGLIDRNARAATIADEPEGHTNLGCVGHTKVETGHTKVGLGHTKVDGGHTKVETGHTKVGVSDTLYPGERGHARSLNHGSNHERKPLIKPCSSNVVENETNADSPHGGWGRPLTIEDLENRHRLQGNWEQALRFNYVSEDLRTQFFTLAKYTARMTRAGEIRNPGAYFTAQVKARNWLGDRMDIRDAINAITAMENDRLAARR